MSIAAFGAREVVSWILVVAFALFACAMATLLVVLLATDAYLSRPGAATPTSTHELVTTTQAHTKRLWTVVGRAPWRSNQRVVAATARQIQHTRAALPGGDVAYSDLAIHLHPDTIAAVNTWMPIEDVAHTWAKAYAQACATMQRRHSHITIAVIADHTTPVGRSRTRAAFRPTTDPRRVATSRIALAGPHPHHRPSPPKADTPPSTSTQPAPCSPTASLSAATPTTTQPVIPAPTPTTGQATQSTPARTPSYVIPDPNTH